MSKYKGMSHIYPKDERAMGVLARSGSITKDSYNSLGITDNRIHTYQKAGLIKEVSYPDRTGPGINSAFVLTDKGKSFCKSECDISHFVSNGNATYHNSKVSDYMAQNLTKAEIDSALSERELSGWIQDRLQEIRDQGEEERYQDILYKLQCGTMSMPDIIYKTDCNEYIAVEITTDSYGIEEINAKTEFAEAFEIEIVFDHC